MSNNPSLVSRAEAFLQRVRDVRPQHGNRQTIAVYEQALELLADAAGSPLWLEAQVGRAHHLLESPDGNKAENVEEARRAYLRVLEHASPEHSADAWEAATLGSANALMLHPSATSADLAEAAALYEQISVCQRARGDAVTLATTLTNYAMLLVRLDGDVYANLDRAVGLLEDCVRVLAESTDPSAADKRGRALHNLGSLLLEKRGTGVAADTINRAVHALEAALEYRRPDVDPVGRAKTLRALARAYPAWSGAESLDHARDLADAAGAEAEALARNDPREARHASGLAALAREQSALEAQLDWLYELSAPERLDRLRALIEHHQAALALIPRDSMPVQWAQWSGGLGRLFGRLPGVGIWDYVDATHDCFSQALASTGSDEHPRLARDLCHRWGEFAHEIADFDTSRKVHGLAADLSDQLLGVIADPQHRLAEIEKARGLSLFAAYGAARTKHYDEALARAEQHRGRSTAALLDAERVMASASEEVRRSMSAAVAEIVRLETALRALNGRDPEAELQRLNARLADYLGTDPTAVSMRRVGSAGSGMENPETVALERGALRDALSAARMRLEEMLHDTGPEKAPQGFGAAEIGAVARQLVRPVVYLMATTHGGMAIAAMPDGTADALELATLTSDLTNPLVFGTEATPGFMNQDAVSDYGALTEMLHNLRTTIMGVLHDVDNWVTSRGAARAVLVPLGSVGLLPLHAATRDAFAFSYAPSSRALAATAARAHTDYASGGVIVANPTRDDQRSLPHAVAEGRLLATLLVGTGHGPARVIVGDDATMAHASAAVAAHPAYLHFACHARFRPSDPLASQLLLAGGDELTLAHVFAREVDLSSVRLASLSACQTANVEFRRTSDETLGFPAALMCAGIPGVVSTWWPVDDAAAAFFSARMYELILNEGLEPVDAVARARVWLRDARPPDLAAVVSVLRSSLDVNDVDAHAALADLSTQLASLDADSHPYESPVDWAAFVLTGV